MLRAYAKGALSFVLPAARNSHADVFAVSPELSYTVFLRHLILRSAIAPFEPGERVAELGPGGSLGFGMAALIAGASHYQAYDVSAHFDIAANLRVFDGLVALFRARTPAPEQGQFVRIFPYVDDPAMPASLSPQRLADALAPERLAELRHEVEAGGGPHIGVHVGSTPGESLRPAADWIASHSVLEHVEDLEGMYAFLAEALAPDGVMTHLIDFSSHGLTGAWNGHWALGEGLWRVLRGRRTYLINRAPAAAHLGLLEANGFQVADLRRFRRVDGRLADEFAPAFQAMSPLDASTHMAFVVARGADRPAA